mmetsp:Transcript_73162/g.174364  ORF Transcript_73162/g.174364 Transcript_73162/m.174364 type:complete len:460 (+) Transcript_73162:85-1464(+)|eukprot:CAMPEP_0178417440 /NCGR_PEP_ID=MMETSP0689_2-20121128/24574_1 /TAXON_ID=160604 /ORGANISM="Amphidinium massartii, Strain CS-259" /LENGTH=459 /DNA_ID=CAMNT_0020038803 /DNA_START=78 /DNA_END=1457 /DNA_ORIENTATION=-
MAGRIIALGVLACKVAHLAAERITFEGQPAPQGMSLDGWYIFDVYSKGDFAELAGVDSSKMEKPVAEISLAAKTSGDTKAKPMAVTLMDYAGFLDTFDQVHFCEDGVFKPHGDKLDFVTAEIPYGETTKITTKPLSKTGKYVLLLSNCNEGTEATLSGYVQVKNPYGYLPSALYHRGTPLYVFLFVYIVLTLGWVAYGMTHMKQFYDLHGYFTGMLAWCIAAIAVNIYAMGVWNSTGVDDPYMSMATVMYVLKWVYIYAIAVFVAGGYYDNDDEATTSHDLHLNKKVWIVGIISASIYIVALSLRECAMTQPAGLNLSLKVKLALQFPVTVLDAILVIYVLVKTKSQYELAEAKLNITKSGIFSKLHKLAIVCAILGCLGMVLKLADYLGMYELSWHTKWLPEGGAAHITTLIGLGGAAFIMRPGMVEKKNIYGKVGAEQLEGGEASKLGRPDDEDDDM